MGPAPEDNQNNPHNSDPHSEELETPNHIIPPANNSSSDEDGGFDSDGEGPASNGYMLLPQEPGEEEEGGGDSFHPAAFPPPSTLDGEILSTEPMTEVRGAGVDVSEAVAQGSVHPAFAASFPDNKVPVHLQVPDPPKVSKADILWNDAPSVTDRLQLDSTQSCQVKSLMVGFQLPKANIPDWAEHIPEDQWKQRLLDKLKSPISAGTSKATTNSGQNLPLGDTTGLESSGEVACDWPGTSGT